MNKFAIILILTIVGIFLQCTQEEAPPIGIPYSQVKGIQDEWILNKVEMSDDVVDTEIFIDVSNLMIGDTASSIIFNDSSYTLTPGSSIHFIPLNGSWKFDNDEFPTQISLSDGSVQVTVDHLHPVREIIDHTLKYRYHRIAEDCAGEFSGKSIVSYIYTYSRKQ